jgi:protein gp37
MNKTKIEWTDYTWNPIVGCKNACWYCYAKKIYNRFHKDDFSSIKYFTAKLEEPSSVKKPSKIFVCSMSDIFADGVDEKFVQDILWVIKKNDHHVFQLLTKQPHNLCKYDIPMNAWVGVTVSEKKDLPNLKWISALSKTGLNTFVSFEPLMVPITEPLGAHWIIIGAMTGPGSYKYQPKKEWIEDICYWAKVLDQPVFMKNSLKPIWGDALLKRFPGGMRELKREKYETLEA